MPAFLPILTFHDIADDSSNTSFPPAVFKKGMEQLHARGFRALGLLEAADLVRRGAEFPEQAFAITFDDGYETVYTEAFPVLAGHGFAATVFLTVPRDADRGDRDRLASLGGRSMLSWAQIREMAGGGIELGAHTLTHPDLTHISPDQVAEEVCGSKGIIEDAVGVSVSCFAYPFGRHDREARESVRQHFSCACSDKLGLATGRSDPHALERVDAYYLRTDRLFALVPSKWLPWYVWARSVPRRLRRQFRR